MSAKCRTLTGQYEQLERARACLRKQTKLAQQRGDLLNHAEELLVMVVEFLNDWGKGDFDLPELAKHDADAMAEKAEKFSRELKRHAI